MSKKLTIEEIQRIAKERGGKCLSKECIDNPIYDRTHKEFVNYCKCISERFKEA